MHFPIKIQWPEATGKLEEHVLEFFVSVTEYSPQFRPNPRESNPTIVNSKEMVRPTGMVPMASLTMHLSIINIIAENVQGIAIP